MNRGTTMARRAVWSAAAAALSVAAVTITTSAFAAAPREDLRAQFDKALKG